jgi:hypothetical protein
VQRDAPKRRKWSELSPLARFALVASGVVQLALLAAALWDLRSRPAEEVRGNKVIWLGVSFINFIGPISYFAIGRKH